MLDRNHWQTEDFKQRMTHQEWKKMLLANEDTITYNACVRQLVAKKLGYGVVEVSKTPLEGAE